MDASSSASASIELTTREAAERLGVSQRTITRHIQSGTLPARRVSATGQSGIFLVSLAELEAFRKGKNRQKPRLTDEHLREVAQYYTSAESAGDSPRQALAGKYGKSVNTIDGWLVAARRRGILKPYDTVADLGHEN